MNVHAFTWEEYISTRHVALSVLQLTPDEIDDLVVSITKRIQGVIGPDAPSAIFIINDDPKVSRRQHVDMKEIMKKCSQMSFEVVHCLGEQGSYVFASFDPDALTKAPIIKMCLPMGT